MDPARAAALAATLGLSGEVGVGTPLPHFGHLAYFWDPRPTSELGPDGHARLGHDIPDLGLPKRMWAGGRLTVHAPLLAGVQAERTTSLRGVTRKTGRSGALAFVTVRHDIRQRGVLALTEDRVLVYREDSAPMGEPPRAPIDHDSARPAIYDAVTLFRYSALTFDGHRIHYDADFARGEGYPGVVVHGPLLATALANLAAERHGAIRSFAFRATAPLFAMEPARLCVRGRTLWVRGPDNRLCMTAEITV